MINTAAEQERAARLRIFALSHWADLDAATADFVQEPHKLLRGPETGLVMLRGRIGSTGAPFNLGEATVTRCAVRLENGAEGHAYILGRNHDHARRAALCDALGTGVKQPTVQRIAENLSQRIDERRLTSAAKAAATKVDFFTMVRGDV